MHCWVQPTQSIAPSVSLSAERTDKAVYRPHADKNAYTSEDHINPYIVTNTMLKYTSQWKREVHNISRNKTAVYIITNINAEVTKCTK